MHGHEISGLWALLVVVLVISHSLCFTRGRKVGRDEQADRQRVERGLALLAVYTNADQ
jgi:hypothetical protein